MDVRSNSKLATMTVDTPTWVVTLKRPTKNGKMRPRSSWINSCDKTNIVEKQQAVPNPTNLYKALLSFTKSWHFHRENTSISFNFAE